MTTPFVKDLATYIRAGYPIVKACQGLTRSEAENALAKAIVSQQGLTGRDIKAILEEKEQIIRKSGILEYTAAVDDFAGIGGLDNLKTWLRQRNEGFSQKARDFGLPNPRGVMLVGVPGCGKSLCAKAVAAEWQKPLPGRRAGVSRTARRGGWYRQPPCTDG